MNQQAEPFLKDMKEAKDLLEADFTQVHVSRPHESAHLHVSGRASYTDDIPVVAGTLHAALGMSALGVGAASARSSHSARPAATLIVAAATNPSPDSTFYDQ